MYANLGGILFDGLKGFSSFADSRATNYAEINRVNRKPTLQRTGERLQEIDISILLHADFSNVEADIQAFEDIRESGNSVALVLGNGAVLGDFVIVSINKQTQKTDGLGNIIYLTAEIKLKEFPSGNRQELLAVKAKEEAFASSIEKVVPSKVVPIQPSAGVDASKIGANINVQSLTIQRNAEIAEGNPARRASIYSIVSGKTDLVSIACTELANKIRLIESRINNAEQIISNAESVLLFASNVKTAVDSSDIDAFIASNATFQQANSSLQKSMTSVAVLVGSRGI